MKSEDDEKEFHPSDEFIHYVGDGAIYCKSRKKGESFFGSFNKESVNCPDCKRLLLKKHKETLRKEIG